MCHLLSVLPGWLGRHISGQLHALSACLLLLFCYCSPWHHAAGMIDSDSDVLVEGGQDTGPQQPGQQQQQPRQQQQARRRFGSRSPPHAANNATASPVHVANVAAQGPGPGEHHAAQHSMSSSSLSVTMSPERGPANKLLASGSNQRPDRATRFL